MEPRSPSTATGTGRSQSTWCTPTGPGSCSWSTAHCGRSRRPGLRPGEGVDAAKRPLSHRVSRILTASSFALVVTAAVLVTLDRSTIQANTGQPLAVTVVHNVATPLVAAVGIAL